MTRATNVIVVIVLSTLTPFGFANTPLKTLTWNQTDSPYTINEYDCTKDGVGTIRVQGTIELVHPNDVPDLLPPQIYLNCDNFIFEKNSKVLVRAAIYIRGEKVILGSINIENTRGVAGTNAIVDPAMYAKTKAANGNAGGRGGNGGNAADTSIEYPFGTNAGTGGVGGDGGRGIDGTPGIGASNGRTGSAAASITIKAGTFGSGTTIVITARGGAGGKGADGGTGRDGGDGGIGGIGGSGGNAAAGRTAADGGRGGAGGDGGNGGWGGAGGDGGNGGNGGNASVLILADDKGNHGKPPSDYTTNLEGGKGGEPGIGGAPGRGGKGAAGGFGGCGGAGSNLGPIVFHPDGACGGQGPHGMDGIDGQPGPAGRWGKDGEPGVQGDWVIGYVVEKGGH